MITLEQFKSMEKGTIFYVCAGGNANNLVVERFHSLVFFPEHNRYTVMTFGGGSDFERFLHSGNGLFLDKAEAISHMERRAKWLHDKQTENLKSRLHQAKVALEEHLNSEAKADYIFLDHSNCEEQEEWWLCRHNTEL